MSELHIFSFFSGSGFLDLGFEKAGCVVDYVNEYSDSFQSAYKFARKIIGIEEPRFGYSKDIKDLLKEDNIQKIQEHVIKVRNEGHLVGFVGGPPCPDFSVAGKQRGRFGENGQLSQSYVDMIRIHKPDFFLFENVKGLWRTAKHRAYFEELKALLSSDYYLTNRLCNALEYGVPQDRDRIFLFGVRRDLADKEGLHIEKFNWTSHHSFNLDELKKQNWPTADIFICESQIECPNEIPVALTAEYWFRLNDVYNHPNAKDYFMPRAGLARMKTIQEGDDSRKSYKRIHRWRYSPTVCYGNNEVHLHPYKERRLSAAEALALQSLPSNFCLPHNMSLSDKFKTIGNGVPYLMAYGVAMTIQDFFDSMN